MSTSIEAQGVTVDEAIQLALNQLGVGRDSVEIKILHHPRKGFLGIGARRAKVEATVREDVLEDGAEFDMSEGRGNRRRRRRQPRHRRGSEKSGSERDSGASTGSATSPGSAGPARAAGSAASARGREQTRGNEQRGGRDRRGGERRSNDNRRDQKRTNGQDDVARTGDAAAADGSSDGPGEQRSGGGRRGNRRGGRGRSGRGRGQQQDGQAVDGEAKVTDGGTGTQPVSEGASSGQPVRSGDGERTGNRSRGRRGGRGRDRGDRDQAKTENPAEQVVPATPVAPEVEPPRSSFFQPTRTPAPAPTRSEAPAAATTRSESVAGTGTDAADTVDANVEALPLSEVRERCEEIVSEMLRLMGFEAKVSAECMEADDEVVVHVEADAEGLLIGRRGQTLDAFEHLVNRSVAAREAAESRVIIDVGGYRDRRRESLLELAARLKERAMREGRRVQVSPMSPRDRKVFQDAFGEDKEVSTRALGTGFYRRVLIIPEGADEREATGETDVIDNDDRQSTSDPVE